MTATWTTIPARPDTPEAATLLSEYMEEMVRRYHRRPVRPARWRPGLAEFPSDDLVSPTGVFLLARHGGELAGCAGLRFRSGYAELTRVFVRTAYRGRGGGAALLAAVEEQARLVGADRIRLDTRSDLVEARALYARHGYVEIPAYSNGPYAAHWFEKVLTAGVDRVSGRGDDQRLIRPHRGASAPDAPALTRAAGRPARDTVRPARARLR